MNTRKQGDIGVAAATFYYTKLGHTVSIPNTEATRYDLIVDKGGELLRVQCKTSDFKKPSGYFEVRLSTAGGNRSWGGVVKTLSASEVDLVFIWCSDNSMWEFPIDELEGRTSILLNPSRVQYLVEGKAPHSPSAEPPMDLSTSELRQCEDCGAEISRKARRWCKVCWRHHRKSKVEWPSLGELVEQVDRQGYVAVGDILGVSDTAVRKRINRESVKKLTEAIE